MDGERPVPTFGHVEKRVFGVPSPVAVLLLASAAFGAAIAAFAVGRWVLGVPLLAVAGAGFALLAAFARRRPEIRIARGSGRALHTARAYAAFAAGSARAWSAANREIFRLRREIRRLSAERADVVAALGAAALDGEEGRMADLRERVRVLEAAIEERATQAERAVSRAHDRLAHERELVQPTEEVDVADLDPSQGSRDVSPSARRFGGATAGSETQSQSTEGVTHG